MEGFTSDLSTSSVDTVVIGGGLAGLVAAHELKKSGRSFVVLEKESRPGGMLRSERVDGYLLELGPNTIQSAADISELIDELKLGDQTVIAPMSTPRYILCKRRLRAVPLTPLSLITTKLLSWSGKFRLLREPWIPSGNGHHDESLKEFAERRLGLEATERLLAPFVAGIWASDIAALSASAAFPKLHAWEQQHGSVLRGMLKTKKELSAQKNPLPRGLLTFKNGVSTLIDALTHELGEHLLLQTTPTVIFRSSKNWRVEAAGYRWNADNVVLATPANTSAILLRDTAPLASAALDLIRYAPLTVIHLGFKPGELHRRHQGFGYLTLPSDKPDILGCVWNSDIFPGRAPDGHTLLTVFVGGSLNPAMADMPERPLEDHIINALNTVMNVKVRPTFQRVTRYAQAIPQYTPGYLERMEIIADAEKSNPGLHIIGNIRGGISVGDVIRSSKTCVARLLSASTHRTA